MGYSTPQQLALINSARRCCFCFGLNGDVSIKKGQIAHLDHNHQNDDPDNLAFLCLAHHDEYDSRSSQSKGLTINEAKYYKEKLYREILELQAQARTAALKPSIIHQNTPIVGKLYSTSSDFMDALDSATGQLYEGINAYSVVDGLRLNFDVTNPNQVDMRIIRFYILLHHFIATRILGVWYGRAGGGMNFHQLMCEIEPVVGKYECRLQSEQYDYVRLSKGEMEAFCINVGVISVGVYTFGIGMEYSIAGESKVFEAEESSLQIGIFDPVMYTPSDDYDFRKSVLDSVKGRLPSNDTI